MKALLWLVGIAAAGVLLYLATVSRAAVTCEVCMRYAGREHCASAAGATRAEAERQATATACAPLTAGVTDTIECQALVPASVTCTSP